MKFGLSFFLWALTTAYALDLSEKISFKILKIFPDTNTIIINRGAEDYINTGEHIKIKIGPKFITRAIAIQVNLQVSYWKLYRVANPELVTIDTQYTMHSLLASEIPIYAQERVENTTYYEKLAQEEQKLLTQIKENNDKLTTDLPPEMDATPPEKWYRYINRELKTVETPEYTKRKVSDALSSDNLYFAAFASPYSIQRVNDNKSINYGIALGTQRNEKYELTFNFSQNITSQKSQFDENKSETFATSANLIFDINRITPKLTYFMLGEFYRERQSSSLIGSIYPVKNQTRIGLTGLKYYLYENGETVKRLDISYIPIWERRVFETIGYDETIFEIEKNSTSNSGLRHSLRLRINGVISESTSFANTLFYRPKMDSDTYELDFDDVDIRNTFILSQQISKSIYFEYQNTYTNDIRLKRENNLEPINMIHQFNLRYLIQ